MILHWIDQYHKRFGSWPDRHSGHVGLADRTWSAIDQALKSGTRTLPGGSSLAKLLREHYGRRHKGLLPPLTEDEILAWADAYHARTGAWPGQASGPVVEAPGERWKAINMYLQNGGRGLPGGTTLAQLFVRRRGMPITWVLPPLRRRDILAWADAWHARTGTWPNRDAGPIPGTTETWSGVNAALQSARRGVRKATTLARLLAQYRGVRHAVEVPALSEAMILRWADAYHASTGRWPATGAGPVAGPPDETWAAVNAALMSGGRSLPGQDSLARLLARRRGRRNPAAPPPLQRADVVRWAQAHHRRTGAWPTKASGTIADAPSETWSAVAHALRRGTRGLGPATTLGQLLVAQAGARPLTQPPALNVAQILTWADAHHAMTGTWPRATTPPPIPGVPHETWAAVDGALKVGRRGLPGGMSLAQLLHRERGARNHLALSPLNEELVLAWADAFHARTGAWPRVKSGIVDDTEGMTWAAIDIALSSGVRGFPGGDTLTKLLARCRGKRNATALPPLTADQIRAWVRAHYDRTGEWPRRSSGPIEDAPGETWGGVAMALYNGRRGLAAGSSLMRLVSEIQTVQSEAT